MTSPVPSDIKMKAVLQELLNNYKEQLQNNCLCDNCGDHIIEELTHVNYILFHKYTFCSQWCSNDCEDYIRREWTTRQKNKYKNKG